MVGFLFRTLWRALIFILGLFVSWFIAFTLFPIIDARLPLLLALIIVYCLGAYIVIPNLVRLWRLVIKPNHIPRYVTTPDGWAADPVNIAVVAKSRRHLIKSMEAAGWYQTDPATLRNSIREAYAIIFNKPYLTAPFSALYLFGRPFDLGFQIPYGKNRSPRHRHHVRFWQLTEVAGSGDDPAHIEYWLLRMKQFFLGRQTVWIGAAVDDTHVIGVQYRNLQLTHANSPEHATERDFIIQSLKDTGIVKSVTDVHDGEPFKMRSQNVGTHFIVDGYIKVVTLKRGENRKKRLLSAE